MPVIKDTCGQYMRPQVHYYTLEANLYASLIMLRS